VNLTEKLMITDILQRTIDPQILDCKLHIARWLVPLAVTGTASRNLMTFFPVLLNGFSEEWGLR
jgi:hypothetical protein